MRSEEFDNLALPFVCLFADLLNGVRIDSNSASGWQILQVFLNFEDLGFDIHNILSSPSQNLLISRLFLLLFLIVFLEGLECDSISLVFCKINRSVDWELVLLGEGHLWPWCPQFCCKGGSVCCLTCSLDFAVPLLGGELVSLGRVNRDILQRKVVLGWLLEHRDVAHFRLFLHACGDH
jgi:hypothetical protein